MRTFLIAYDLARPVRNKHVLATAIMSLGQAWARPLEHMWFVRADANEAELESRLLGLLDDEDGLVIQAVNEPAALVQTSLRWFKQRQTPFEIESSPNVIAFPSMAPPAAQAELPLAS